MLTDSRLKDIKLHKPQTFDRRFLEHFKECKTYKEAYRRTEADYKAVFGEKKYASYNSFRNAFNSRQR